MERPKRLKRNYKPLAALVFFILGFILFAVFITRPSTLSKAVSRLESSNNIEDVKEVWSRYKGDLSRNDQFVLNVREKLASFNPTEDDIQSSKQWLPQPPEYLNVIVVPDLSRRIIDTFNNPEQVTNDTVLLNHIWRRFEIAVRLKKNSKDRLMIDVTDNDQAGGKFRLIANKLIFDLSDHQNQSNRLYFDKVRGQFQRYVSELYNLARREPLGADYWFYFDRSVVPNLKKSNIYEDYRNIIILVTDGYLEAENRAYTGDAEMLKSVCNAAKSGKTLDEVFQAKNLRIPKTGTDLKEVQILVLEVNERKAGEKCDFDVLKKFWTDWFKSMNVKNANDNFFIARQNATDLTKEEIDEIIDLKEIAVN